jgi:hypothetical protein
VVRIEVVADIAVDASPGFEGLELRFRLAHVGIEVVEIAQSQTLVARIRICGVESLVMFYVDENTVFLCCGEELEMLGEEFDGGFGY